jgi:carboxymethylenebutenolidase
MAITSRYEQVTTEGGSFDAYCAVPESGRGPGILMFQEIFGINDNMRGLADRLAGDGYVVLVPDMFWRLQRRFESKDESGMQDGIALVMQLDMGLAMTDIQAAHAHLLAIPECTGKVGAVGFCLGGGLAFACAATSRIDGKGPDAAVAYYGSHVNALLHLAEQIECPVMYHYGEHDSFIPPENIDAVEKAVAGSPGVEFHRYDAGHAFSNFDAPSFYDEAAADRAWARTSAFFARHLKD